MDFKAILEEHLRILVDKRDIVAMNKGVSDNQISQLSRLGMEIRSTIRALREIGR